MKKTCTCGKQFDVPESCVTLEKHFRFCPACVDRITEQRWIEQQRISRGERFVEWHSKTPREYLKEIDAKKLSVKARKAMEQVIEWAANPGILSRGLILTGPTGAGKSRSLYAALKHLRVEKDIKVEIINHETGLHYGRMMSLEGSGAVADWVHRLSTVMVLGMDDIFKVNLTPGWEGVLFTVIENRLACQRAMVITTQDIGDSILQRMSPDRGPAIVRRLRECCETISFS